MKLTVAIPCYNEIENVPRFVTELLPEVRKLGVDFEILVVDDGSKDGTADAAERLGIPELRVVRHQQNRGLGGAIRTMFAEARGELLVTMDADLTFAPSDIAKLLERYRKGDVDFVIGSHGLAGYPRDIPRYRVWVSKLANVAYSILAGQRVQGISSIFRLYRTEIVKELKVTTSGYETPAETFFRLVKSGYRFAEVPTPLGSRRFGTSKLNYKKEIPRHLRLVRDILLGRLSEPRGGLSHLRSWLPGIVVAIALGVLYSIPNVAIPLTLRAAGADLRDYHPLSLGGPTLDEVASYGARIREIIDGHLRDGDAYLAEYKNRPSLWGNAFLTSAIGIPARLIGIRDPTPIFIFGDALFPLIAGLVVYGLMRGILRDRWISAGAAFFFISFPNLSAIRFGLPEFSLGGLYALGTRIFDPWFSRIAIPSPGIAVFAAFLWSLVAAFREGAGRFSVFLCGIFLGLSLHVYFYYGAFAWVSVGTLLLLFLANRAWTNVRRCLGVFVVGAAVSIPYLLKTLALRGIPYADELQRRVGIEIGRDPRISPTSLVLVAVLVPALLVLGRRLKRSNEAMVLAALLGSTLLVTNLQLLLGFNVQSDHWGSRVSVYIYALGLAAAVVWMWEAARLPQRTLRFIAILAFVFFLGLGATDKIRQSMETAFDYRIPGDVQDALRWIDRSVPRDTVVVTPSSRSVMYIPLFTHANVYFPPASYTVAPDVEVRSRWLELVSVFGVREDVFIRNLLGGPDIATNPDRGREFDPAYMLFAESYSSYQSDDPYVKGDSNRPLPPEVIDRLLADHRAALAAPAGPELRLAHRADYLFYGPSERLLSSRDPSRYENLVLVYQNPSVRIYKID